MTENTSQKRSNRRYSISTPLGVFEVLPIVFEHDEPGRDEESALTLIFCLKI